MVIGIMREIMSPVIPEFVQLVMDHQQTAHLGVMMAALPVIEMVYAILVIQVIIQLMEYVLCARLFPVIQNVIL